MTKRQKRWSRRGALVGLLFGAVPFVFLAGKIISPALNTANFDSVGWNIFLTLFGLVEALAFDLIFYMAPGAACGWCAGFVAAFVIDRLAPTAANDSP